MEQKRDYIENLIADILSCNFQDAESGYPLHMNKSFKELVGMAKLMYEIHGLDREQIIEKARELGYK